jgi:chromosome segregation ATPase
MSRPSRAVVDEMLASSKVRGQAFGILCAEVVALREELDASTARARTIIIGLTDENDALRDELAALRAEAARLRHAAADHEAIVRSAHRAADAVTENYDDLAAKHASLADERDGLIALCRRLSEEMNEMRLEHEAALARVAALPARWRDAALIVATLNCADELEAALRPPSTP